MWDPKYSVNNEVIDAQHKEFFSIFNRIVDLHKSGSIDVDSILRDLVHFVSEQFHKEHLIMRKTNYPDFLQHSQEHDMFIEAIQGFLKSHKNNDEQLVHNMLVFLNDWVSFHILKSDLKYGEYLATPRKKEGRSAKESRRRPRITTSIKADYWKRGSLEFSKKTQKATIINLSFGGCCLLTQKNHMIDLHSKIHLVFKLDNNRRTKIEREAIVCSVNDDLIGCRFTLNAYGYEPDFVSYMNEHIATK